MPVNEPPSSPDISQTDTSLLNSESSSENRDHHDNGQDQSPSNRGHSRSPSNGHVREPSDGHAKVLNNGHARVPSNGEIPLPRNGTVSEPLLVPNGITKDHSLHPWGSHLILASQSTLSKSCSFKELDEVHTIESPKRQKLTCAEKVALTRNLYVISVCFMLIYSAFNGMQNLASSLLQKDSLGLISLSCVYAFAIISCFLTPCMLKLLTPKWSLAAAQVAVTLFLGSLLYPRLYTVIPTSVIWGVTSGLFWTAASLYVITCAMEYGVTSQRSVPTYAARFTGIWMMFQQASQIIGNLISSLVLRSEVETPDLLLGRACGAQYDRGYNESAGNSTAVAQGALFTLGAIYLCLAVVATFLGVVFLKPFRHCTTKMDYGSVLSLDEHPPIGVLLSGMVRLMKNSKMYLTIPLSFMVGMQMCYLFADFTEAFVACGLGVNYIGLTMICFGVTNSLGCYLGGRLCAVLGRVALFTVAFCLNIGLLVTMLVWEPGEAMAVYFTVPAVWGLVDAILQPQSMAFVGCLFPMRQEQAFSIYNLFKNLGMAGTMGLAGYASVPLRIYLALGVTAASVACYYTVEFRLRRGKQHRGAADEAIPEIKL